MPKNKNESAGHTAARDTEYLKILAENLESGVSILDKDMNYVFLSDSVYRSVGANPDELKPGDPLSKCHEIMLKNGLLTPEILAEQHLSAKEQIAKNVNGDTENVRLMTLGDGTTYRFVRKNLSCGKTISIADDVSELVHKETLLEDALALGNAGYWSYEFTTKKYTLSKSFQAFFGPEIARKVETSGIASILCPEDRIKFKETISEALKTNKEVSLTTRALNHKGEACWTKATSRVIRDAHGKAISIQSFIKDVTLARKQAAELEQAKDEAIAASQAKSEFLANMSHEIRTPMNGILGMAELLGNSEISDRQRQFVSVINNSASALLCIINDILDFSKIEAGAFVIDPVPFDLKSSINDVTSLMLSAAQEKDLELVINYPVDLPKNFIGDAGRIRQVITNLVSNAVKFTKNGHIRIDVDVKESRNIMICTVDVTDTGIGIPATKLSQIFDKFTQADGSTTRVYGGTGLGLTISKHIVEMMGGRMRVESEIGKGSIFGFCIPLPLDPDAKVEAFNDAVVAGKRALIVDDIAVNRDIFTEQLKLWGLETDTAVDGVDALSKLKAADDQGQPFDLILLDYLMPGMNGQEFAQLVTGTPSLSPPQIIMLSSCDQPVNQAALERLGIDSYLIKPAREQRLFDTIVRVLSNPAVREQAPSPVEFDIEPAPRTPGVQEILVAEDFALNQDVVKLMLSETCFKPVFANNGQEAVDTYLADPARFPLIFMDVSMPVMDGYEASRQIRRHEIENGLDAIPIIALTGHALKNDRDACLEAGMNDYLSKPVKQLQLLDKIETHSGRAVHIQQVS